ncbi:hypothetical protein E2562_010446 [Oryza meyeriana var. granulata]|uniref:Uncharacterized protein n=1 Tax=Oryza meyeriana var. granulata TaxID=110450 RepID=A0A6G1F6M7_9ORYZ|nr:hypothetical protein E2562_010446 [Oryza meyeriana var. granulata]
MAVLILLVVSGSARPLGGDKWAGEATSGDHPLIQFLQNLYLQQLGSGASCKTYDPNNPSCHH